MALLSDYAAAEASLKLELARQYPDINVSPATTITPARTVGSLD
jgi:hypothetical protein